MSGNLEKKVGLELTASHLVAEMVVVLLANIKEFLPLNHDCSRQ